MGILRCVSVTFPVTREREIPVAWALLPEIARHGHPPGEIVTVTYPVAWALLPETAKSGHPTGARIVAAATWSLAPLGPRWTRIRPTMLRRSRTVPPTHKIDEYPDY